MYVTVFNVLTLIVRDFGYLLVLPLLKFNLSIKRKITGKIAYMKRKSLAIITS